ncbi:bacteriorhodopsin-like [Algoriphagus sp. NF]|jgi:bacteriorhodopsin|uniref:Bacteriorhodopsin n=1 Tax=Algoriphagus marincola TaxID=264027 RepID=A0ABS7N0J8_9BACT|nr:MULTISPECIES: bacteriorhodopsin-like [Algoriphagus]MBY5949843.1 bacteriorhodopsin [Algoriphagus marincola]MCR9082666.1 bacteriorhodopsin-like [Cyclobacteriaceae bacterium]MDE0558915.1 bacteriorhodopsin-like [Algoriphagus sp. NF]
MNITLAAELIGLDKIINSDPIAITFFIGYMAMFASSVFFFVERGSVDGKWKTSLLVSGLITGIAAVHYYYMRDFYLQTGSSPTAFRYVDWTLTVPLMCVEFYLLTKPFGAKGSTLFKLIIASLVMLVTGYIGETSGIESNIMWGIISTLGYLYIVYEVFAGDVAKLAKESDSPAMGRAMFLLKIFITLGWSIYPIGYMVLPGNLLSGAFEVSSIDLFYNLADAINKIGFGLVIYYVAITESSKNKTATA